MPMKPLTKYERIENRVYAKGYRAAVNDPQAVNPYKRREYRRLWDYGYAAGLRASKEGER